MALLGVLSRHLPIDAAVWLEAIRRNLKPELYEVNRRAFEIGRDGPLAQAIQRLATRCGKSTGPQSEASTTVSRLAFP